MQIVQACLSRGSGGSERHALGLSSVLAERHEVTVLTVRGGWLETASSDAGLDVAAVTSAEGNFDLGCLTEVATCLRKRRPRVVHSHLGRSDWYMWLGSKWARPDCLASTEHGISDDFAYVQEPHLTLHRWAHRFRLLDSDVVFGVSEATAATMRLRYGSWATGVVTAVPQGIDWNRFANFPRSNGGSGVFRPVRFLFVGRLEKEKGTDVLLQAFEQILSDGTNAELTVVGSGSLEQAVVDAGARTHGRIMSVGQVPDVLPLYARADVLVLPSRSENAPLALLEGMAAGLPIVATETGAVGEVVRSARCGRVVVPGDPVSLVEALTALARTDVSCRNRLGACARRHAKRYDITRTAAAVEAEYMRVLHG